jgi:hypothetical protein
LSLSAAASVNDACTATTPARASWAPISLVVSPSWTWTRTLPVPSPSKSGVVTIER